jgi:1,5-anhydro-D-fructose reductase (1,5-anhydro-D-mannitol-forming)
MPLGWGVIGAGGIARRRMIPEGILPARNAELVAIMEPEAGLARRLADECYGGVKWYTSAEELAADPDVDAVFIGSPPRFHCEQTIACARAGKHVLCEKPMALNVADAERMTDECRKHKAKLGVDFMLRYHACHEMIREMVERGDLGTLVLGRASFAFWYPPIEGAFRQNWADGGGGAIVDVGNHMVDLLEVYFGRTRRVGCFQRNLIHGYETDDTAVMILEFASGAQGMVNVQFALPSGACPNPLEIYGSRGSAITSGTIGQSATGSFRAVVGADGREATLDVRPTPVNMYQAHIEDFTARVESGEEGVWSVRVTTAAYASAETGKIMAVGA